jgi:hypothetical protein
MELGLLETKDDAGWQHIHCVSGSPQTGAFSPHYGNPFTGAMLADIIILRTHTARTRHHIPQIRMIDPSHAIVSRNPE